MLQKNPLLLNRKPMSLRATNPQQSQKLLRRKSLSQKLVKKW